MTWLLSIRCILGVICWGSSVTARPIIRLRRRGIATRTRQAVLERLGWNLHRVWSTEWWFDQEGETERLMQALAVARDRSAERERRHAAGVAAARAADAVLTASGENKMDGDDPSDSTSESDDDGTDATQPRDDSVRNGSAPLQVPVVEPLDDANGVDALMGEAPVEAAQAAAIPDVEADVSSSDSAREPTRETSHETENPASESVSEPSSELPSHAPSDEGRPITC